MAFNPMNNPMYDRKAKSFKRKKLDDVYLEYEFGITICAITILSLLPSIFIATSSVIVDGYFLNTFTTRQNSNVLLSLMGSSCPLALSLLYVLIRHKKIGIGLSIFTIVVPFVIVFVVTWISTIVTHVLGLLGIN